jgi:Spy/CpxP family protein refolding chaperone
MRLKPLLSFVLLASFSGTFLVAQQPGGGPPMGPGGPSGDKMEGRGGWGGGSGLRLGPPGIWWHNPDLIQKLTLTPDQQKKMDDILQQSKLQLIDLRANVEKQEVLMEPMLAANPPDTNKILAQIDHTAQARAELEKANAKMLLGIRNILTPDQWTKLQAEGRERRRMRMRGEPDAPGGQGTPQAPGGAGGEGMLNAPANSGGQHQADDAAIDLSAQLIAPQSPVAR